MRSAIVRAVVDREIVEILRNRMLLFSILLPPIILTILPVILLKIEAGATPRLPETVIAQILASHPEWADLDSSQLAAAFTVQQFLDLFLILPGYIPVAIASYSIVGEKQTRSLEAILATPIRTTELLAGKAIAAVVPGVLTAWIAYGAMLVIAAVLLGGRLAGVLIEPAWLAAVFTLGPPSGLVSVAAGVIVSSRVNDPRAAQQIGGLIILPLVGLVVLQTTGSFVFGVREYLVLAVIVAAIGVVGIRVGTFVFGRETILTRWK
jgi:ABC-2 type transport system permease protein